MFSGNTPKQPFILQVGGTDGTVKISGPESMDDNFQLTANATYVLHVYAVIDANHDGLSDITSSKSENEIQTFFGVTANSALNYQYFFGDNTVAADIGEKFGTFLDKFWSPNLSDRSVGNANLPDADSYEAYFERFARSQQLMDANKGFYINESMAAIERRNGSNNLTLVLAESFGIVNGSAQTFEQIDWTITGYRNGSGGQTETHNGIVTGSGVNFVQGTDLAGYPIYSFTIPEVLPAGYWQITIHCRITEDPTLSTTGAAYSDSFVYRG